MNRRLSSRVMRALLIALVLVPMVALGVEKHPGEAAFARDVAQRHGLDTQQVEAILNGAVRQQSVLDAIQRPAETKPWRDYRPIFLTSARIDGGIAFYRGNRALLQRVADEYDVDPEFVVAILGVETSYGTNMGRYRVLDALATLAFYYPPRAKYFRGELEQLLAMPPAQLPVPIDELRGSYAGAMGWGQFMPTSIKGYARDEDGDGRIDLMNSMPDVVASVANYLARHGWQRGAPVAVQAEAGQGAQAVKTDRSKTLYTVGVLESRGYAPTQAVPAATPATLLQLDGASGRENWLTFDNFQVITRYNRSPLYAMAVTQLAYAIRVGAATTAPTTGSSATASAAAR